LLFKTISTSAAVIASVQTKFFLSANFATSFASLASTVTFSALAFLVSSRAATARRNFSDFFSHCLVAVSSALPAAGSAARIFAANASTFTAAAARHCESV
jgi:hypothetical protein